MNEQRPSGRTKGGAGRRKPAKETRPADRKPRQDKPKQQRSQAESKQAQERSTPRVKNTDGETKAKAGKPKFTERKPKKPFKDGKPGSVQVMSSVKKPAEVVVRRTREVGETVQSPPERIAKRIARAGVCSRREAEVLIAQGRVTLDGKPVDTPATIVGPDQEIAVDGEVVAAAAATQLFRYHKVRGVLTASRDPEGRPTIYDKLPAGLPRLMPVGRLDMTSEGLLLLTNDGGLKRYLELPKTGWVRRYRVRVYGKLDHDALAVLKDGITVDGIHYGRIDVSVEPGEKANRWLKIGLHEGKNREIRRVMNHLGLEVSRLIRTAYGPFQLGSLKEGHVEQVTGKVLKEQLGSKFDMSR